ncbi:MAG: hypothetical protein K940chlam6_01138 [Chlamydiae bacterium]|nr:hypothetical protein [Chlamydiota bacterium]
MAIYELFDQEKKENFTETFEHVEESTKKGKSHFFSTLVTRCCFFLLLIADSAWLLYNSAILILATLLFLISGGKNSTFKKMLTKAALNMRRSVVCALALFIGLFSPPFGIMVACTYFLMYDKAGMEEVVPAPLQAQFKDIFNTDK